MNCMIDQLENNGWKAKHLLKDHIWKKQTMSFIFSSNQKENDGKYANYGKHWYEWLYKEQKINWSFINLNYALVYSSYYQFIPDLLLLCSVSTVFCVLYDKVVPK